MSDQWAAPGSQTSQPSSTQIGFPDRSATSARCADAAVPLPRPLPMRPQSVLEVLDSGFVLVRSKPWLLFSIVAVFNVPVAVLAAYLRRDSFSFDNRFLLGDPTVTTGSLGVDGAATTIGYMAGSLIQTIAAVAIGLVVTGWYSDRDPDVGSVLAAVARRIHWVLIAWLLVHVIEILGLVGLVIGSLLMAVLMVVVAPVIAVEGAGPLTAIKRSVGLVRGRYAPALGFFIFSGMIAAILGALLGGLPTVVGLLLGVDGGWVLVAIGSMISGIVSTSFLAAATVAFYFDLRVRREGIDLHLAMLDRFPT